MAKVFLSGIPLTVVVSFEKRDVVKHRGNESWQLQLHEVLLGHSLNLGGDGELRQLCGSLRMSNRCTGTVVAEVGLCETSDRGVASLCMCVFVVMIILMKLCTDEVSCCLLYVSLCNVSASPP